MLQNFVLGLLVKAAEDEKVREFVADQIARLADKLKADLLPDIVSTFPAFTAAVVKTVFEKLPDIAAIPEDVAKIAADSVQHILESAPDIPGLSNIIDLTELARKWLPR